MGIESRAFRQAAAQFATGVTVVSFELDGEIRGMTANSFTSVSLDPPLILFCVTKNSRTGLLVERMERFCVNVLGDHQRDVSAYFAGSWNGVLPPSHVFVPWAEVRRLGGALAALSCRLHGIHEGGDHWIVVGEVVAIDRAEHEGRPLVFYKGSYVNLEAPGVRLEDAPMTIAWSGPFG
jgi:flavin reductase (DIM6/NTAB) family NADH-FMN oxidoreductase RutF